MAPQTRTQNRRDRAVRSYVRRELRADLATAPPIDLAGVGDGAGHLIQPTRDDLLRSGSPVMRARAAWASTWGSWRRFLSVIEPSYRPVHYFTADGVAIGAAAKDLVRLAALGADWLRAAGLQPDDTVALLEGATSAIEPWQLSGGTRRAGVPLAVVEDPADARLGGYSVIAGKPAALAAALRGGGWPGLRMILLFGRHPNRVTKLVPDGVALLRAWAVPGTRSVWFECVGGEAMGWHTAADAELVEVGDDDEVLWTGVGWAGTVFVRLRTETRAAAVETARCPSCGHRGPRLFLIEGSPALARWLRDDPRVAEFRLTADGADVLPVRAGANARLVKEAGASFPDCTVTVKTKRGWQE